MKIAEVNPNERFKRDYSLSGVNAQASIDKGLASAQWYTCPISRKDMNTLLQRKDGPAIRDTIIWFALLISFGALGGWLWGSLWCLIPFAIYGALYAGSSDSRWHECSHGTAFKTDWMNEALYEVASFMIFRESTYWRYSHARHHSDTIILGRDTEIPITRPCRLFNIFKSFFAIDQTWGTLKSLLIHASGKIRNEEKTFIPEDQQPKLITKARIFLGLLALVGLSAIYFQSFLPLMYIGLPTLYGSWLMLIYGYTQHAGLAENVLDHRLNCRTVYMNFINRYLYWNMNYHIEHHMFPLVPYYNLPKLHKLMVNDCPKPYPNLWAAWKEIIASLFIISNNPEAYVERELPEGAHPSHVRHPAEIFYAKGETDSEGWLEIDTIPPEKEEVIRFDHQGHSYAIYRSEEGKLYATDGICTHGNSHLSEGVVKGNLIECSKHNGRFDIRNGSCKRNPVNVPLKTHEVKEEHGKLFFKPNHQDKSEDLYRFKVVSNHNVATYIKELVLEPISNKPSYQPGDYLQLDIPTYDKQSLENVELSDSIKQDWQQAGVFDSSAENPLHCRRNYSLASNPDRDHYLKFNIRLATSPTGSDQPHGIGSSYVFGLKAGDEVSTTGSFGDFHIKDSEREIIYLGGGAGMAPLRSHISYLLETKQTQRKISFWYGARSKKELFYQDYFKTLEERYPNFSFHIALSEPKDEDHWNGHTGFIHNILENVYLHNHADPSQIEYYLCGPPPMVQASKEMLKSYRVSEDSISHDAF